MATHRVRRHSLGDQRRTEQAGLSGTASRPAYLLGGSATEPRGRGQGGDRPASDAIRTMLEELYWEIIRANGLGSARALVRLTDEGDPEPDE